MKHTSVESADLPDYFRTKYQWTQSAHTSPTPAKGRKGILNAVSSEAPSSFQLKHVASLTPDRRREALLLGSTVSRDTRLMQDLGCHSVTEFRRFMYYDFRSKTDLNSIPLGRGVDLLTDHNAGARVRLPFYQAHAEAANSGRFKVRQGMFSHAANQRVVRRTDDLLLSSLKRVQSEHESPHPIHFHNAVPRRTYLSRTPSCDMAFSTFSSQFNTKSTRYVLKVARKGSSRRATPTPAGNVFDEMTAFDHKLRTIDFSKPVTKISLGLV